MQVSDRAKKRGRTQLGTLGAGNHYVEVQVSIFAPLLPPCPPPSPAPPLRCPHETYIRLTCLCDAAARMSDLAFTFSTCIWPPAHVTVTNHQLVVPQIDSCNGDSSQTASLHADSQGTRPAALQLS